MFPGMSEATVQKQDTPLTWTSRKGCPRLEMPPSHLGVILEGFSTPRTRLRDHVVRNILKVKTEWLDGRSKQRRVYPGLKAWRGHPASRKGGRCPRRHREWPAGPVTEQMWKTPVYRPYVPLTVSTLSAACTGVCEDVGCPHRLY